MSWILKTADFLRPTVAKNIKKLANNLSSHWQILIFHQFSVAKKVEWSQKAWLSWGSIIPYTPKNKQKSPKNHPMKKLIFQIPNLHFWLPYMSIFQGSTYNNIIDIIFLIGFFLAPWAFRASSAFRVRQLRSVARASRGAPVKTYPKRCAVGAINSSFCG